MATLLSHKIVKVEFDIIGRSFSIISLQKNSDLPIDFYPWTKSVGQYQQNFNLKFPNGFNNRLPYDIFQQIRYVGKLDDQFSHQLQQPITDGFPTKFTNRLNSVGKFWQVLAPCYKQ